MKERKYVSTLSMICMCIGSIIGGGIFGSMCLAIQHAEKSIIFALAIAYVISIISTLPALLPSSITPAASGYYTIMCRIISPYLGPMEFASLLTTVVLSVSLSQTFAIYFTKLVPVNTALVSCSVITVAFVIAYMGFHFGTWIQNIMTVALVCMMILFVIMGMTQKEVMENSFFQANVIEGKNYIPIFAAAALLMNCLDGGDAAMVLAAKMKNPRKGVLIAFFVSTSIVALLYLFMSLVVLHTMPGAEDLAVVAAKFMDPIIFRCFIIFGALTAIATTINCVTLSGIVRIEALTRDQLLPQVFAKRNQFGQSYLGAFLIFVISLLITLIQLPLDLLFSILSTLSLFMMIFYLLPILKLHKQYPHSWKHSPFNMPLTVVYGMILVAILFCLYQIYALVKVTASMIWLMIIGMIILFYAYFFIRKAYLKKRDIDILAVMKKPLPEWEEKEAMFKKMDQK